MSGDAERCEDDYAAPVLARVPWLLRHLDREVHSPSFGSFDLEHWGWKFRDHPLGVLQTAVHPLALIWSLPLPESPYHRNDELLTWIVGAIERTLSRQRKNGSFDLFTPFDHDFVGSVAIARSLSAAVAALGDAAPDGLRQRVVRALDAACTFGLRRRETHGFISNHQALAALAFLEAHQATGKQRFRERADGILADVLRHQSADGWYDEYGGPDPGYESLGIHYLSLLWAASGSEELRTSLARSVDFLAYCVHPDGSLGGVYGSRHTSLYFPAGLERLAGTLPMAGGIARFLRRRLHRGGCVTPAVADIYNLIPLATSYLEAWQERQRPAPEVQEPLPCESLAGVRCFEDSAICAVGSGSYYGVFALARGGLGRLHDKLDGRLAHEDAGYVATVGRRSFVSQLLGLGRCHAASDRELVSTTRFGRPSSLVPTPLKFLVLRLLNLTVFRVPGLAALVRRLVVARLITRRVAGPFELTRTIGLEDDAVRFHDRLSRIGGGRADALTMARSYTAIHMGSAKYFHPSHLGTLRVPTEERLHMQLQEAGVAEHTFEVRFR